MVSGDRNIKDLYGQHISKQKHLQGEAEGCWFVQACVQVDEEEYETPKEQQWKKPRTKSEQVLGNGKSPERKSFWAKEL